MRSGYVVVDVCDLSVLHAFTDQASPAWSFSATRRSTPRASGLPSKQLAVSRQSSKSSSVTSSERATWRRSGAFQSLQRWS